MLPAEDRADAALPTGGKLQLRVDDLREIVAGLDAADPAFVRDFGLADAALESHDPFVAGEHYVRAVERWLLDVWTRLAFYDPDCERIPDDLEPW
jgi:hypothetical protein